MLRYAARRATYNTAHSTARGGGAAKVLAMTAVVVIFASLLAVSNAQAASVFNKSEATMIARSWGTVTERTTIVPTLKKSAPGWKIEGMVVACRPDKNVWQCAIGWFAAPNNQTSPMTVRVFINVGTYGVTRVGKFIVAN